MKLTLISFILILCQSASAGETITEMELETKFYEETGHYKIWSEGDQKIITFKETKPDFPPPQVETEKTADKTEILPPEDKKSTIKSENLSLIQEKLAQLKKLKNVLGCEDRKIQV